MDKDTRNEILAQIERRDEPETQSQSESEAITPEKIESDESESSQSAQSQAEQVDVSEDAGEHKEKKTAYQKRLDKLTRQKKEAEERAFAEAKARQELEEKLAKYENSSESDGKVNLDKESQELLNGYIEKKAKEILEQHEKSLSEKKAMESQQNLAKTYEEIVLKDYADAFDEESGAFDDDAINEIYEISDRFQKDPEFWLDVLKKHGAKKVYKMFIKGEVHTINVNDKKERVQTPTSSSISSTSSVIDKGLRSKSYAREATLQAIKQLKGE